MLKGLAAGLWIIGTVIVGAGVILAPQCAAVTWPKRIVVVIAWPALVVFREAVEVVEGPLARKSICIDAQAPPREIGKDEDG